MYVFVKIWEMKDEIIIETGNTTNLCETIHKFYKTMRTNTASSVNQGVC